MGARIPRGPGRPWVYHALPGGESGGRHTGFALAQLSGGQSVDLPGPGWEAVVVPLRGSLEAGGIALSGRADVWDGPTDVAYLPAGATHRLRAGAAGAEVAVGLAPAAADAGFAPRRVAAAEVAIEMRGEGATQRQVRHLYEGDRPAQHLLVVEVITPPGHWSSFPPHRHDEPVVLEEYYYCESRPAGRHGYVHIFDDPAADGRPAEGAQDEALAMRNGDLALVRRGYHTAASPPGSTLYYLNVMAGPSRSWTPVFHPAYRDLVVGWERAPISGRR